MKPNETPQLQKKKPTHKHPKSQVLFISKPETQNPAATLHGRFQYLPPPLSSHSHPAITTILIDCSDAAAAAAAMHSSAVPCSAPQEPGKTVASSRRGSKRPSSASSLQRQPRPRELHTHTRIRSLNNAPLARQPLIGLLRCTAMYTSSSIRAPREIARVGGIYKALCSSTETERSDYEK